MERKEKQVLYAGIIPGLIIQFVGALCYFVIFKNSSLVQALYGATKIALLVWPLIWVALGYVVLKKGVREYTKSICYGLALGGVFIGILFGLFFIYEAEFRSFSQNIILQATAWNLIEWYILFAIGVSLIHSLLEEYYWRWFIFSGLHKHLRWEWAAIISSIGFASHHYIILHQFFPLWMTIIFGTGVGVGGFLWCALYKKTNSIIGPWISHILVDGALFFIGYLLIFT
ncbi:MAG: CPBP family intramembrane metalloprotease [Candidatus Magasanikbacteria bacterium]|jgi:uncharacterized protein|nr:CPBP family intramembrane metalloprotease [Candidatus Magasanikbacteria bacterium]MBT4221133.1 CPBP family intramembrane metalloprotease [Candidatus Magasanikbacteria bacterium]MBT4350297.1 CPBP family intramembrane metalloprotease [Candidatus Magasanikbacteria bacterium]MBT4541723.1 CPBP family intramembrane metalloprotease [Candidatus Magasanikbacteria bacterium]MBT6253300.1 CPBP family intramembrane metalloprotease [Candidatus Magasanikbacteria bacterium]